MSKENRFVWIHEINGLRGSERGRKKGAMWGDENVATPRPPRAVSNRVTWPLERGRDKFF